MRTSLRYTALLLLFVSWAAHADEGFWTFQKFPSAQVQERYDFTPSAPWREHVERSTVLVNGCSGAFVSTEGLVVTSDNCLRSCLDRAVRQRRTESRLSEACRDHALREAIPLFDLLYCAPRERDEKRDHSEHGYLAHARTDELSCPQLTVKHLEEVQDVTSKLMAGHENETDTLMLSLRGEISRLVQTCAQGGKFVCEVETLYSGAVFRLLKYRAFEDVRLVFMPERDVSEFGGSNQKFSFPRSAFPLGFVRVYDSGAPLQSRVHLGWSENGAAEGELVFLSGFPAYSLRHMPVSWLNMARESFQEGLLFSSELRGVWTGHAHASKTRDPKVAIALAGLDSSFKQSLGSYRALDAALLASAQADELRLRQWVQSKPTLRARYEQSSQAMTDLLKDFSERRRQYFTIGRAGTSGLLQTAINIIRGVGERGRPLGERYPGFTDHTIAELEKATLRPLAAHKELEIEGLAFLLRKQEEELGPRHPVVRRSLDGRSPDELARHVVEHTALWDVRFRRSLWQGGANAIANATDPLIRLARILESEDRRLTVEIDTKYNAAAVHSAQALGQIRYAAYGESEAPDASISSRLRFGQVKGLQDRGTTVPAFNALSALYGLETGKDPFRLPERWTRAKSRLDLTMPLTFSANTDALFNTNERDDLGGPLLNAQRQIVGVAIGGSEATIGADYRYREDASRTVGLHSGAILQVLERVYEARSLVEELRASSSASKL